MGRAAGACAGRGRGWARVRARLPSAGLADGARAGETACSPGGRRACHWQARAGARLAEAAVRAPSG